VCQVPGRVRLEHEWDREISAFDAGPLARYSLLRTFAFLGHCLPYRVSPKGRHPSSRYEGWQIEAPHNATQRPLLARGAVARQRLRSRATLVPPSGARCSRMAVTPNNYDRWLGRSLGVPQTAAGSEHT